MMALMIGDRMSSNLSAEMAQKNATPALLLSLLITLLLSGAGLWWVIRSFNLGALFKTNSSAEQIVNAPVEPTFMPRSSVWGPLLFPEGATAAKVRAIEKTRQGQHEEAVPDLVLSLQQQPNDPEALIYLNNLRGMIIANSLEQPLSHPPKPGFYPYTAYSIAVVVPIASDPNGSLEILRGVAQAQLEINQAGGIGGKPLMVLIVDDEGDPAIAPKIASKLAELPNVIGVVGHYTSDSSIAAATVYQAQGLVAISPVSTSVKLSNVGDYIFRTVPSDYVAGRVLADYTLQTLQEQKVAVFYNFQSGYSRSLKSEFGSALALGGGRVVGEYDLSAPNFDPSESVARAEELGATALALLPNTEQIDRALQVVQASRGQFTLLGGDDVYTPKTLEVAGQTAQGMVLTVPWHILAHSEAPFVAASYQLWGGDVNWRTVTAYDATQALIQALKQVDHAPNRAAVKEALRSSSFEAMGATEPIRFLSSGDRSQAVQLVTIKPGDRSGYGFDFVPLP